MVDIIRLINRYRLILRPQSCKTWCSFPCPILWARHEGVAAAAELRPAQKKLCYTEDHPVGRQPNLFILGAAKCGTTSLAKWLSENPEIFTPAVKEPHHYNSDEKHNHYPNRDDYLGLFEGGEQQRYRLDASTWYLHSHSAVPNILNDCPDAQFLVCLRNPADMAFSLHSHLLNKTGREDIKSFEEAWSLSDERLKGRRVPSLASEPAYLAYKYSCRIGTQCERLLDTVDRHQVHFIVLDDLIKEPQNTLRGILDFLAIPQNVPLSLPHENAGVNRKSLAFHRFILRLTRMKNTVIPASLPRNLGSAIGKLNLVEGKSKMSDKTRRMVTRYFHEEIHKIWDIRGVRYEHWTACIDEESTPRESQDAEAS